MQIFLAQQRCAHSKTDWTKTCFVTLTFSGSKKDIYRNYRRLLSVPSPWHYSPYIGMNLRLEKLDSVAQLLSEH